MFLFRVDESINASGTIVTEFQRKTVSHSQIKSIDNVYIKEGEFVAQGALLIQLDNKIELMQLGRLNISRSTLYLTKHRIEAALKDQKIIFYSALAKTLNREFLDGQGHVKENEIFKLAQSALLSSKISYAKQIERINGSIKSFDIQTSNSKFQLDIINQQLASANILAAKKLTKKSLIYSLLQQQSNLKHSLQLLEIDKQRARHQRTQIKAEFKKYNSELKLQLYLRLMDVDLNLKSTETEIGILRDKLAKLQLHASAQGIIFNMLPLHAGYIIRPGEALLQIIPEHEKLVIDSRLPDSKIKGIHINLATKIYPKAANRLFDKPIDGIVTHVSTDALTNTRLGENLYLIRIEANDTSNLIAGMSVDLHFITGNVRLVEYILSPLFKRIQ
ncbi:MAG: HlyD family efflux transporter periplasmic adaptor subunit [Rhizobiales bacterium]|nr:HlyD family secretion protein [Hyphomicrobiales bacterium]NRB15594.1 HlyD family efflux transporter periplasmic adaptor subunit [Hyphomicrobiales bacterium]